MDAFLILNFIQIKHIKPYINNMHLTKQTWTEMEMEINYFRPAQVELISNKGPSAHGPANFNLYWIRKPV